MRLIVTASQTPFMSGGATYHVNGVVEALRQAGHEVELVRFPFHFAPESRIEHLMHFCDALDFNHFNGIKIDRVISLQFPGYGVLHDDHRVWVMHQHRSVYELYDAQQASPDLAALRDKVIAYDNKHLSKAEKLFANSTNVAGRLKRFNQLDAETLYHPPYAADRFYSAPAWDYVLFPSRLETLKRQSLLIEAAQHLQTPVKILLVGTGGQQANCESQIEQLGLEDRVALMGHVSEAEKLTLYARALGVFFGPYDEDYGYVTLEAMLAGKPVISCTDSGGPLEFIRDGETGMVCDPDPLSLASAIDDLYRNRKTAERMGINGRQAYEALGISWQNVISRLMADT
ncbi:glycosyltransferase family 4 protein [Marinobacterium weihaiense]|uniref:Glycosyltransferase family 4 protein n=1 Tax=Marinobacterium weihaiense TaxID=2851016 RepID=A0ABS6M7P1_9GAMM|nr:glycosyltransferase family 4 protein [Marinobacterium weihaiense]MBV0932301.1 glycosyltransferase family 4 protein [Marinobacterium weihaiense]